MKISLPPMDSDSTISVIHLGPLWSHEPHEAEREDSHAGLKSTEEVRKRAPGDETSVALSLYTEMVSHEPSDVTASGILAKSVRKWRMPSQLHMLYTCSAHGWVCPTTWIELELMILWSPKTKPQPSRHLDHGLGKVVEMKSLRQRPGLQNAC